METTFIPTHVFKSLVAYIDIILILDAHNN
jgi:hypothetical protein